MKEYWNEAVHACHLLLELVADRTKFFTGKAFLLSTLTQLSGTKLSL